MSNNITISKIIIGLIVLGVIGYFIGGLLSDNSSPNESLVADEVTDTRETIAQDSSEMDKMDADKVDMVDETPESSDDSPSIAPGETLELTSGIYTDYDPSLLANAESGDVVLFFHAGWCPSCRGLEKDIEENLGDIPDGVTIMKLNFDTETDLKKKYGVVRQHTLVRVDAAGNKIETLTGLTNTLDQVVAQL